MKKIVFTNHALKRLARLSFWKNPLKNKGAAERLLSRADKVYTESRTGVDHYRRGSYRFVVKEMEDQINVITIIKE